MVAQIGVLVVVTCVDIVVPNPAHKKEAFAQRPRDDSATTPRRLRADSAIPPIKN